MAYLNPSIDDFKLYWQRAFPFGTDIETSVTDTDIANAYQLTNMNISPAFFSDQASYNVGYMYLSAHFLAITLRASSQGLNATFAFLEQGKGVGSVNQSFAIPEDILKSPVWSMYMQTPYGAQYLQLILPYLSGSMFIAVGSTRP